MPPTLDAKDPDRPAVYDIDWADILVEPMKRDSWYDLGQVRSAARSNGYYYECTRAGLTSKQLPLLTTVPGQATWDGSAGWTARHPTDVSVPQVQSATWAVTGLTVDSQQEDRTRTFVTLSGGTDGQDYSVTCTMTSTLGDSFDQTVVVPVRSL